MALDPRVIDAVKEAVQEGGQPTEVATRLVAWLESLADGNENLNDRDAVARRLDLLYEVTVAARETENAEDGEIGGAAWPQ